MHFDHGLQATHSMMKARPRCLGTRGREGGDIGNNRKLCGFGFSSFGELGEKGVLFSLEKEP